MSRRKDRKKWGVFSRHSDRDKEISERDEDDPRQDIHTHPSTKRVFLPPPVYKPIPYLSKIHQPISSDRDPSGNPVEHRRNQGVKPVLSIIERSETPNHRGKSLGRSL